MNTDYSLLINIMNTEPLELLHLKPSELIASESVLCSHVIPAFLYKITFTKFIKYNYTELRIILFYSNYKWVYSK